MKLNREYCNDFWPKREKSNERRKQMDGKYFRFVISVMLGLLLILRRMS
jgi:hypothetical protein